MRIDNDIRIWIITSLLAIACAMAIIVATNVWGSPTTKYFDNHEAVIQQILFLESSFRHEGIWGDHGTSYGIAQFKKSTFDWMKCKAGMPWLEHKDMADQITLLNWAILNGYESHWKATHRKAQERAIMGKYIKLK